MNIHEILEAASKLRIAVVGDLILDRYIDGTIDRISPEAPVAVLRITGTRENPGGAGNVVENLKGLGVQVNFFHQPNPPIKTRVMSGSHHIIRMDDEDVFDWMKYDDLDIGLEIGIREKYFDCVVISDYSKGCISGDVIIKLIRACNEMNIPTVVDTKHQIDFMHRATLVKCNQKEWLSVDQPFPESPWTWMEEHDVHHLVVTNGASGMQYWTKNDSFEFSGNIPGIKTEICDPCGAGDTVTAVLAMCMAMSLQIESIETACKLANQVAAYVCTKPGVYAIKKEDFINLKL